MSQTDRQTDRQTEIEREEFWWQLDYLRGRAAYAQYRAQELGEEADFLYFWGNKVAWLLWRAEKQVELDHLSWRCKYMQRQAQELCEEADILRFWAGREREYTEFLRQERNSLLSLARW
jgi:hypothetical protein